MRDGLNPVRLRLPQVTLPQATLPDGAGHPGGPASGSATSAEGAGTVLAYLIARFPRDERRLREKVAAGEVVDEFGRALTKDCPLVPGGIIYLYRDPPTETRVPFEIEVLYRDENLLVVDKPHFLASTPRGAYVMESVVVRLRQQLDLPELSPAHRLDRVTAGVLVLTTRREVRGAYQQLFATRAVRKTYEAVAGVRPDLSFPQTVRSRIVKESGVLVAQEVAGEPNSESVIDLVDRARGADGCGADERGAGKRDADACGADARDADARRADGSERGRYLLRPHTGKTHQLRLHMASLGLPILNDNFYPAFYDVAPDDYTAPVQLLARSIEFTDPLSGEARRFESGRVLSEWSSAS